MSPSFARSTRLRAKRPFPGLSRCLIRPRPFQAAAPVGAAAPRGLGAGGEREGKTKKPRNGFAALTTLRAPSLRLRFATPLSRLSWRPNEKHRGSLVLNVVGRQGLEPWTNGLRVRCSTN